MKQLSPLVSLLFLVSVAGCTGHPDPEVMGRLRDKEVDEASGIAASNFASDRFWVHNDSGGRPVLYSISPSGVPEGRIKVLGVSNVDWEDVSSFEVDGKRYLLIADVGDNNAVRHDCSLIVIEEPDPSRIRPGVECEVKPAWIIPVVYEDGPRDCEAVAVDAANRQVYLLSKRTHPPALYRLPLFPTPTAATPKAAKVGDVSHLPQPSMIEALIPGPRQSFRANPTAMDFSRDGRRAMILTYGELSIFVRAPSETWARALSRQPDLILSHVLPQGEGACFSRDGTRAFAVSEGKDQPVVRWTLPDAN